MCSPNCRLFEVSKDRSGRQSIEYCVLAGVQTLCKGEVVRCERIDSIRDYVLQHIEELNQA